MAELVDPTDAPTLFSGGPSPERTRVLDTLTRSGRYVPQIAAICGMSIDAVRAVGAELGMLELDGLAVAAPNGWRQVSR